MWKMYMYDIYVYSIRIYQPIPPSWVSMEMSIAVKFNADFSDIKHLHLVSMYIW